jgi:hypothetical protein
LQYKVSSPGSYAWPGEFDLMTDSQGTTTLEMYSEIGRKGGLIQKTERVAIDGGREGGSSVGLYDQEGKLRTSLGVNRGLCLLDDQGTIRAALGSVGLESEKTGCKETTAPSSLTLFDKKGTVVWRAP